MVVITALLILYIMLFAIRIRLMIRFYSKQNNMTTGTRFSREFSVIQPIVSGDPDLEANLKHHLAQPSDVNFLWVVDEADTQAIQTVKSIQADDPNRIQMIVASDIPEHVNEKVWKQQLALPYARRYFIAMDDDTRVSLDDLDGLKEQIDHTGGVLTAVPHYRTGHDFWTNLVVGFVNGNTLLTYPVISELNQVASLNGMFYCGKTELFNELNIFERIHDRLSDEYEIAAILKKNGIPIVQLSKPCSVSTAIRDSGHYWSLMKRWMVFAGIYMGGHLTKATAVLIPFATALPLVMTLLSLLIEPEMLPLIFAFTICSSSINFGYRRKILKTKEPVSMILYECLAQLIQPIHYFHSLVKPNQVLWRKNLVTIGKDGSVHYEREVSE